MFVIGTADEARGLARGVLTKTRKIYELTKGIDSKVKILGSSFQDSGYKEYEECVQQIYQSMNAHFEDVTGLQNAINAYAELLESQ